MSSECRLLLAVMAATLGVAAFAYLPYAFFNLLNPLTTVAAAFLLGRTTASAPAPAAQFQSLAIDETTSEQPQPGSTQPGPSATKRLVQSTRL